MPKSACQHHGDVRSQQFLGADHRLRGETVFRSVQVGTKGHAVVVDVAQALEAEDLEAATIGEDGVRPAHEAVQPPELGDDFRAGAEVQMVGIGQDEAGPQFLQVARRKGLDGGLGAHGAEHGSGHVTVGRMQGADARLGVRTGGLQHPGRMLGLL